MNYIIDEEYIQEAHNLVEMANMAKKWRSASNCNNVDRNVADMCAVYLKRLLEAATVQEEEGSGSGSGSGAGEEDPGSGSGSGSGNGSGAEDVEQ